MKKSDVEKALAKILPVEAKHGARTQGRLDRLTKPPGSLGRLEELAVRFVSISGRETPKIRRKAIFTFAADHGVAAEGVSAYPKEVTAQMVYNFLRGGAAINVLSRHVGAEVRVIDIGVDHDFEPLPGLINRKVARGTKNMVEGPAMTREELFEALQVGIDLANEAALEGIDLIGTGEMGIANTTASSAIAAVITGEPVRRVSGRGTGVDDRVFKKKLAVIKAAIARNRPDPDDPLDVLQKVGGLEIAGITGLIIGAAKNRIPVVIDGFIAGVSALIAVELNGRIKDYLIAAHRSVEAGHGIVLRRMGLVPIFDLGMRLGEGTGAALGIGLIDAAVKILTEMATFSEAGVSGKGD